MANILSDAYAREARAIMPNKKMNSIYRNDFMPIYCERQRCNHDHKPTPTNATWGHSYDIERYIVSCLTRVYRVVSFTHRRSNL